MASYWSGISPNISGILFCYFLHCEIMCSVNRFGFHEKMFFRIFSPIVRTFMQGKLAQTLLKIHLYIC